MLFSVSLKLHLSISLCRTSLFMILSDSWSLLPYFMILMHNVSLSLSPSFLGFGRCFFFFLFTINYVCLSGHLLYDDLSMYVFDSV